MRVVFAGTPAFAEVALARLLAAPGIEIVLVLTQPDRPSGRGLHRQPSAVKALALAHGLPLAQPQGLRAQGKYPADAAAAREALLAANGEAMVVAAYGLILPQWVLDLPPLGCFNIHASLLPRWRGAAPIHRAIEAGDARTGITIMRMDAGLDTGEVLLVESLPIAAADTTGSLHDRLASLGGRMVVDALAIAARGELVATPQPADGVTYARKVEKAEAAIDWAQSAVQIERRIRAFDPFPGATAAIGGELLKVWRAALCSGRGTPGAVLAVDDSGIQVACGDGALRLNELQRPGGKRLPARAFLQGRSIVPDSRFDAVSGAAG